VLTEQGTRGKENADVESSSRAYARRFDGPVGRWFLNLQTRITLESLASLPPGASVLDVGGGHAQVAPPLLRAGYAVTVAGSHASCSDNLEPLISSGRLRFDVADLQALPYEAAAFDGVICYRLIAHSIDWRHVIGELCGVARHRVLVDYPSRRSVNAASGLLFKLKHRVESGSTRPFALYSRREVARAFARSGFTVSIERPQFLLPMALYRMAGSVALVGAAEGLARSVGLTGWVGSPVIARADRLPTAVATKVPRSE
jgi:ubiquinone/menaquinone biosynthesis C-methylase UbiE